MSQKLNWKLIFTCGRSIITGVYIYRSQGYDLKGEKNTRPLGKTTCHQNLYGVSRKSLGPKRIDQGLCRSIDLSPTISQTQRCQDDAMAAITI